MRGWAVEEDGRFSVSESEGSSSKVVVEEAAEKRVGLRLDGGGPARDSGRFEV